MTLGSWVEVWFRVIGLLAFPVISLLDHEAGMPLLLAIRSGMNYGERYWRACLMLESALHCLAAANIP